MSTTASRGLAPIGIAALIVAASLMTACSPRRVVMPKPLPGNGDGTPAPSPPPTNPDAPYVALALNPSQAALQVGYQVTLEPTLLDAAGNNYEIPDPGLLEWSVSDASVLSVAPIAATNGHEMVTAKWIGSANVLVSYRDLHASMAITVTFPSSLSIFPSPIWLPLGFATQLELDTANWDVAISLTNQATWSVADPTIARLDASKVLRAGSPGKTTVTATYEGVTFSADVTVMPIQLAGTGGVDFPPPNWLLWQADVAIDGQGVATATWSYSSGEVYVSGHDATGWLPATALTQADLDPQTSSAHVYTNAAGARLVVVTGSRGLRAAFAPAGKGFGPVQTVPTPSVPSNFTNALQGLEAVVTNGGAPMIEWEDGMTGWINKYDSASGTWLQPTALPQRTFGRVFNGNGDLFYVGGSPADVKSIRAAIWSAGSIVSSKDIIAAPELGYQSNLGLALNDERDALLTWGQQSATPNDTTIELAQYSTAKGWFNVALPLPTSTVAAERDGVVAMNASGSAMVAWVDPQTSYIWVNRYTPAGGWEPPYLLNTVTGIGTPSVRSLALDTAGNAVCIFADGATDQQQEFEYRRYHAGQTWDAMVQMEDQERIGNANGGLTAAYNAAGTGIMSWQELTLIGKANGGGDTAMYNFMEFAPSTTN
jgi:hypothetical protein